MSDDQHSSSPLVVYTSYINFVAKRYFSPLEMAEARRLYKESGSYVQLTDWNQGIQAILKEKPGEQKQLAWSRQLGSIWRDQQTKVKRQLAFF